MELVHQLLVEGPHVLRHKLLVHGQAILQDVRLRGEGGGGDAGQSGNIDVSKSHAGAVRIKVLRVRKLPTLSQKTFCWCVFKSILCALISDLMIILCPLHLFLPHFSTRVPQNALCDVTKGVGASPGMAKMPNFMGAPTKQLSHQMQQ